MVQRCLKGGTSRYTVLIIFWLCIYKHVKIWYGRATGNGQGCGMQTAEVVEQNQSVSQHRVKTWPQLMCCALI